MVNLFAYRATDPEDMKQATDPHGPENYDYISFAVKNHKPMYVIACWGVHGEYLGSDKALVNWLRRMGVKLHVLGLTKEGHPRHPLYVKQDTKPQEWA